MPGAPAILGLGTSVPERAFSQEEAFRLCGYNDSGIRKLFENSGIRSRRFFFDSARPKLEESSDELNQRFLKGAMELSQQAIQQAFCSADIRPSQVDLIVTTSCTGYLCPDLATRLVRPLDLRNDVERTGIQGMGCAGAMPALQRAADFVAARGGIALVVAVEICSAAYFIDDDLETAVGNAICGDGAAAVLIGEPRKDLLSGRLHSFYSRLWPEHLDKVGFSTKEGKLRIVLKKEVRDRAPGFIQEAIGAMLSKAGLAREEITHWVLHPGGWRIIERLPKILSLPEAALQPSFRVLETLGNLSSPTVLFVLKEALEQRPPQKGDCAILLALGPGLAAEGAFLSYY